MTEAQPLRDNVASSAQDDLVEAFRVRAERAASVVHECPGEQSVADLIVRLADDRPVVLSATVSARYPELGSLLASRADVLRIDRAEDVASAGVGVSAGKAMVAETGSVLVSEHDLADRTVSMLSTILVQIVPAAAILPTLDQVGALLADWSAEGRAGYQALITGPSRSADIERSLTVGVQGPAELHVAILYPATPAGAQG